MAAQVGLQATNLADKMLNAIRNTSFANANTYVKLHTGIPGADGTANAAAGDTTRVAITFAASSAGSGLSITGTQPVWTKGSDGSETVTHCSVWSHVSNAGTMLWSFQLGTSKTWTTTGDTLTLTACGLSLGPLASS